jgi:ABC-type sugar transport system ATPase subunit
MPEDALIVAKGITKAFSGVVVLKNIDFQINPGEVHGVVGENGAGKTTLMKIINGVFPPTEGSIFVEGKEKKINSPHNARQLGIVLIHQEPLTFQDLNVTENIFLGNDAVYRRGLVDWKSNYKKSKELLNSLEVDINERALLKGMSIADQQMVEIASALSLNAKVIIMDEPTSALSLAEVKSLFSIVRRLKEQGKGIVFIGHRLEEIMEVSDRITVLRDGEKVGERMTADIQKKDLVQMMIGRTIKDLIGKEEISKGDEALAVENISLPGKFNNISIKVHKGEIVGMAGLVGAGRTEVGMAIFGVAPALAGVIKINGEKVNIKNPQDAMKYGIAMVSEDRAISGLLLPFSVEHNITFAVLKELTKNFFINFKMEDEMVEDFRTKLDIKMRDSSQEVRELSGGNQQKVVLAKWLLTEPDILILDEPTRGIDIGAKSEVYKLITELARQGKAILMISSELPEILQMSDRVYVMCEGRMIEEFNRSELNSEKIMIAASTFATKEERSE